MVNFGTYLLQFRNRAWASEYLSYEELKAQLYRLADAAKLVDEEHSTWQGREKKREKVVWKGKFQ